jgi:cation diffusion facilitator CzcD-associated flavoprotein CzcO
MALGRVLGYRPDMPGITIVRAGLGGIGMGIALEKPGFRDFVILDKGFSVERRAGCTVTGS